MPTSAMTTTATPTELIWPPGTDPLPPRFSSGVRCGWRFGRCRRRTGFQRDLAVSYERLGGLAHRAGRQDDARANLNAALEIRTSLFRLVPQRVDLAEELAATLCQHIDITNETEPSRSTALGVLEPLEQKQLLTPKGVAVLTWLREGR
jgi:hypothetical protein